MRPKYLVLALGFIIFLGVAGYSLDMAFSAKQQPALAQPLLAPETTAAMLASFKQSVSQEYPYVVISKTEDQVNKIGYQFPGYSFKVLIPYAAADGLSFNDTRTTSEATVYSDFSSVFSTWQRLFAQAGMQEDTKATTTSSLNSSYFYVSPTEICGVTVYTLLDVSCGDRSSLSAIAEQAVPLVALYDKAASSGVGEDTVGAPAIRPSETPDYSIATMTIYNGGGTTAANFYKQNSGTWALVNLNWYNDPHEDGDIIPNCGYFESDAGVRAAFSGQACYNSATGVESTID